MLAVMGRAGGVPVLPAGPDTTAGKVTRSAGVVTAAGFSCRCVISSRFMSNVTYLLQLVMQVTGVQTVLKHVTVQTEMAAVTL